MSQEFDKMTEDQLQAAIKEAESALNKLRLRQSIDSAENVLVEQRDQITSVEFKQTIEGPDIDGWRMWEAGPGFTVIIEINGGA